MKNKLYWLLILPLIVTSCISNRQIRYFNDLPDSARIELPHMAQVERTIQDGDRLSITIGAEDGEAAALFNTYGGVPTSGTAGSVVRGGTELQGYLVAADGTIELPYIGKVSASGLTSAQFKVRLTNALSKYLKNPLINVKFYEIKFTVLGEVRRPGTYNLPLQRTTFLDALGAAGDLPVGAKRHDIQVYRDYNGVRTIFKVDLRKSDILYDSELFQIRHNDVIYVQQRERSRFIEEARLYASLLTLGVGIFAIFNRIL